MGYFRAFLIVAGMGTNFLALGWAALIFGDAGVLGEAAIVAADDALVGLILALLALAGNVVLGLVMLIGRSGRRQAAVVRSAARTITCPRCGATGLLTSIRFCSNCGLERSDPTTTGTPTVLEVADGDYCPRCRERNRTGERFCRHCGFQLRR
jgi:ribosomal protein L37E